MDGSREPAKDRCVKEFPQDLLGEDENTSSGRQGFVVTLKVKSSISSELQLFLQ